MDEQYSAWPLILFTPTGLSAALTSVAPQAGIQFASYHFLSSAWDKLQGTEVNKLNQKTGITIIGCIHASLALYTMSE